MSIPHPPTVRTCIYVSIQCENPWMWIRHNSLFISVNSRLVNGARVCKPHNRPLSPFLILLLGRVRKGKLPPRYGQTYLKPISTISTPYLCWPSPDRWCFLLVFHWKLSYFYDDLGKIETRGHEIGTDPGPRTLLSGFSKTSLIRPRSTDCNFWPLFF